MIDKTSPEQRSRWTEYIRAMQERREQRGLPPAARHGNFVPVPIRITRECGATDGQRS